MRGKPFEIGNKMGRGRPRGSRNKATNIGLSLEEHKEAVVLKFKQMALTGDPTAIRLYMAWLLREAKPRSARTAVPKLMSKADLPAAWRWLIGQVADKKMIVEDGRAIAQMFEGWLRSLQAAQNPAENVGQTTTFDYSRLTPEQVAVKSGLIVAVPRPGSPPPPICFSGSFSDARGVETHSGIFDAIRPGADEEITQK